MRRVVSPDGRPWEVDVHWTGRSVRGRHFGRARQHLARARARRKGRRGNRKESGDTRWPDFIAGFDLDFDILAVIAIAVGLGVAVYFGAPILSFLAVDAFEVVLFPLVALVLITWRALHRSSFTLTAECEGRELHRWQVTGVRVARAMERSIAEAVIAVGDPAGLFQEARCDVVDATAPVLADAVVEADAADQP